MKAMVLGVQVCLWTAIAAGTLAQAATKTMQLPADAAQFEASELPGYFKARANCMTCHSAEYVRYQPPTAARSYWEATVRRMKAVFNAPVEEADVNEIVDYLVKTYGRE